MKQIIFLTGNALKTEIANKILGQYGAIIKSQKFEVPEIQAINGDAISAFGAKFAAEKLNKPVIKSDVSYEIKALRGFPGPFVKFINSWLTADQLLKLMDGTIDRSIEVIEHLSLAEPSGEVVTFRGIAKGKIADRIHLAKKGSPFDQVLIREGYEVPQNMMSEDQLMAFF